MFNNDFSKWIWEQNYKGKGERTVNDTFKKLAKNISMGDEKLEHNFFDILSSFKFIPGGRIMANLKGDAQWKNTTPMNCFVYDANNIDEPDSIAGIYEFLTKTAHTLKSEGGFGCVERNSKLLKIKSIVVMEEIKINTVEVLADDINVGDYVLSYDIIKKKNVAKKVLKIHNPIVKKENQLKVIYGEKDYVITSKTHPMLTYINNEYIYKETQNLKVGNSLRGVNNLIKIVDITKTDVDENFIDFTIEGTNNYYTKNKNSKNFIIIHNSNFSYIRPEGTFINGVGIRTPGVMAFLELWDKSADIITRGSSIKRKEGDTDNIVEKNKPRKGAQIAVLDIWHPDIKKFIIAKQKPNYLTKFNMSVGITEGFMNDVKNNEIWELVFPDINYPQYDKEWKGDLKDWKSKNYPIIVYEKIKATKLWDLIMQSTYQRNEPGVIFLDLANRLNPLSYCETIYSTNPCGEILMSGPGVCCLGSINLTQFYSIESGFDIKDFKYVVRLVLRFLDNVNELANVPLPEYKQSMISKRRIGLGIMGLGSLMYMMGIRYGSDESVKFINRLMKEKCKTELIESSFLAEEKGSFPLFSNEFYETEWFIKLNIDDNDKKYLKRLNSIRNGVISSNQPTGNTSIFANIVSGGIEPVFMKEYIRWVIVSDYEKQKLLKYELLSEGIPNPYHGEWYETNVFKFVKEGNETILKSNIKIDGLTYKIDKNRGLIKPVEVVDYGYEWAKKYYTEEKFKELEINGVFTTTEDLTVEDHINTLEIISKYTGSNNSKTINISNDYPYEKFKDVYMMAYDRNIKGITTYRAGTMTAVIEKKQEIEEQKTELEKKFDDANGGVIKDNIKLPDEYYMKGHIVRDINNKKWYFNIAFANKKCTKPFALFIQTNNHETTEVADSVINEMEELLRKKKIKEDILLNQQEKYKGQSNVNKIARAIGLALRHNIKIIDIVKVLGKFDLEFSSLLYHIKKYLERYIKDGTKISGEKCPMCKSNMSYYDGCKICNNCGYGAC